MRFDLLHQSLTLFPLLFDKMKTWTLREVPKIFKLSEVFVPMQNHCLRT